MANDQTQTSFIGFLSPNTTPVPDQLFDELLTLLSGNELKVVLYIIRRTFGFKKQSDTISLNQMLCGLTRKNGVALDRGVGLSKPTLLSALRALVSKGIIVRERRRNDKRGNLPTRYCLKLAETKPVPSMATRVAPDIIPPDPPGKKPLPRVGKAALPTTTNRLTRIENNVVRNSIQKPTKPKEQVDYLVDEIERHTGDTHSRGNFAGIASVLADHKIFELLAEMRQDPGIRNRGAWFTAIAKRSAQSRGEDSDPPPTKKTPETSILAPPRIA